MTIKLTQKSRERAWVRGVWNKVEGEGLFKNEGGLPYYDDCNPLSKDGLKGGWHGYSFVMPDQVAIIIPREFT